MNANFGLVTVLSEHCSLTEVVEDDEQKREIF